MSTNTITESKQRANHEVRPAATSIERPVPSIALSEHGKSNLATDTIELAPMTQSSSAEPLQFAADTSPARAARNETIALACMCWCLFLAGFNDGTLGPLLPRIQQHFDLGFTPVSLLFIASAIGFICGSVTNMFVSERFSLGKVFVGGSLCQVLAYALQAPAPPFPVMCIASMVNGLGVAIQNAQANALVASMQKNANAKMGILHAAYGMGALVAPLVSTQFAQMSHWNYYYLVSLGIALSNSALLTLVFRGNSSDVILREIGSPPHVEIISSVTHTHNERSMFRRILGQTVVHIVSAFALVYVGVEVTIGGWIVTYVIYERGGGPSSGYISSGFFGGLTFGRVALLWVNRKLGPKHAVYLYTVLVIGLELTVWLVPSLIGNAVAVALVGMLLGPMYPICMNQLGRVIPRRLLTGSIGWIAGFGQAGSAIVPFITGALAGRFGIGSLQPLIVASMVLMGGLWFLVPAEDTKEE